MADNCKDMLTRSLATMVLLIFIQIRGALPTDNATPEFRIMSGCTCTGYRLSFQCTTVGAGATIWRGSAFTVCPSSLNEILLYHSRFTTRTATGSCNNGNIIARALDATEGQYRSELNIPNLTSEMNGTTVECLYDDGVTTHLINSTMITITTDTFPPPMNISLNAVSNGQLHFSWSPVTPRCSAVHYNINASSCGKCPIVTNSTSATCTDVEVNDEELCNFGVSTVVCSDVIGVQKEVAFMLSVPNITSSLTANIDVTPTYMHDINSDSLMKLTTEFKPSENLWITPIDMIQLNTSVKINYTDSKTGRICGDGTVSANSCTNGVCSHEFEIDSSVCPQANFTVNVFATNDIGDGETSSIRRDHINNYVKITRYPSRKMFSCEFLPQFTIHYSKRSCNATYFDESCQTELLTRNVTSSADYVKLSYRDLPNNHSRYCYIIAASNGTLRVNFNGNFTREPDVIDDVNAPNEVVVILSILLPVIMVMGVIVIGMISMIPHAYLFNHCYNLIMSCRWPWRRKIKMK